VRVALYFPRLRGIILVVRKPPFWVQEALHDAVPAVTNPQALVGQTVTELMLLAPPEIRCTLANGKTCNTNYPVAADGTFQVEDKTLTLLAPRIEWRTLKGAVGDEVITWGTRILLAADDVTERVNRASTDVSLSLLQQSGKAAEKTQKRLSNTFAWYAAMLGLMFVVGLTAFVVALVNSFVRGSADSTTTVVFGGLSAVSFVTFFLAKPVNAMGRLGPHSAWLLAIVNTYWTKLAYLNDPETVVSDIEEAQESLNRAFVQYLTHAGDFAPPEQSSGDQMESESQAGSALGEPTTIPDSPTSTPEPGS
jgi:hypothetical protein